jgi:hypothetical protein
MKHSLPSRGSLFRRHIYHNAINDDIRSRHLGNQMSTIYCNSRNDGYLLDSELEPVLEWEQDSDMESLLEME